MTTSARTLTVTEELIQAFGGLSEMARRLGHRNVTTIFGWRAKDKVPHWRVAEICDAADRDGITLPDRFLAAYAPERLRPAQTVAGEEAA